MAFNVGLQPLGDCKLVDLTSFRASSKLEENLSIMCINVRILSRNYLSLLGFLSTLKVKVKILVICETWLNDDIIDMYKINNYKFAYMNRNRHGGGLLVYYLEHFTCDVVPNLTGIHEGSHESLCINLEYQNNKKIKLYCVYRPPRNNVRNFMNYLNQLENQGLLTDCIMIGDININTLDLNIELNRNFINFMSQNNFYNTINHPTYLSINANPSLIDHIWIYLNIQ